MRIRVRRGRVSGLAIVGVTLAVLLAAGLIRLMTGPSRVYVMADPSVAADTGLRLSVSLEERGVSRSVWTSAAHTDSVGPIAVSWRGHLVVRISASTHERRADVMLPITLRGSSEWHVALTVGKTPLAPEAAGGWTSRVSPMSLSLTDTLWVTLSGGVRHVAVLP